MVLVRMETCASFSTLLRWHHWYISTGMGCREDQGVRHASIFSRLGAAPMGIRANLIIQMLFHINLIQMCNKGINLDHSHEHGVYACRWICWRTEGKENIPWYGSTYTLHMNMKTKSNYFSNTKKTIMVYRDGRWAMFPRPDRWDRRGDALIRGLSLLTPIRSGDCRYVFIYYLRPYDVSVQIK